jgi:hypothetical protein
LKKHSTLGCCGIDCGLCPRYQSKGSSACPGCGGPDFRLKHPSCGFLTCCSTTRGFEVCSECTDYPCKRFEPEKQGLDSFVTHRRIFQNHDYIKKTGIDSFLVQQKSRIRILNCFIDNYDDGRSKNFFCICCTLLPLERLQKINESFSATGSYESLSLKEKNKILKETLIDAGSELNIELKLNTGRK